MVTSFMMQVVMDFSQLQPEEMLPRLPVRLKVEILFPLAVQLRMSMSRNSMGKYS